jgi:23S rRNA (guanosine2251-2'-O)-methyltransferase
MGQKIYGRKPVLETLKSGRRKINRIFLLHGSKDFILNQIQTHAYAKGIEVIFESKRKLDALVNSENHQGVVALEADFEYEDLDSLFYASQKKSEAVFGVMLDEIEDPQNFGAIVRSADAFGVHGVIIPKHRASGVTPTTFKASAGAIENIPIIQVGNLNETIRDLKKRQVWVIGTSPDGERNFFEWDFKQPSVLVFGNEGRGLRQLVKTNCDVLVKIPMKGTINSLNASVSAAILMSEVYRQREWTTKFSEQSSFEEMYKFKSENRLLDEYSDRYFFRSSPTSSFKNSNEGDPQKKHSSVSRLSAYQETSIIPDPPGKNRGGKFHW